MIFLTVGTQLPFDRLTSSLDAWVGRHPEVEAFAQVGHTRKRLEHVRSERFLAREELDAIMRRATLIVAHAGMGTILTSLRLSKPILVMPRSAALGEHRNEHQKATAKALERSPNIYVAEDTAELETQLDRLTPPPPFEGDPLGSDADSSLIEAVRAALSGP